MRGRGRYPAQLVEDEDYQLRHERVAGIDVAKAKADVCTRLPPAARAAGAGRGWRRSPRRRGRSWRWPGGCSPTGWSWSSWSRRRDYWRIWYYLLEGAGLSVQLVNSSHARQLAGRPKTDRLDAQWIARLAEMGLLRPSFVPPPEIRALRDLTRTRLQLVRDRTREWQRLEKLLEGALVKLSSAVTRRWPGPRRPAPSWRPSPPASATRRRWPPWPHGGVKGGHAAVRQSLEGMTLGGHHPRLIRMHLDHITLLDRSVAAIEDEIEAALDAIEAAWGITADGVPSPDPGPDAAALAAAERLAEIPGVSPDLARAIIAETGLDMTRFPTAGPPRVLGRARPGRPPVRPPHPQAGQGAGRRLPEGLLHPGRRRRIPHRHLPRRAAPPPLPAHRRHPRPVRGRQVHPRHHLAPAVRPRRQVPRPRPRLARAQDRPRPQDPRPPPPAPGPRPRRHPHRTRRLNPKPR